MIFKIWSVLHILFILSPFAIFIPLYFLLKNKSQKTKYIVGITLGTLSLFVLILRNVDIFLRNGWDLEVIPLQVCHIGNIVSGLGLILRKKWLLCTTFCFNLIPALCAIIFADSLANYDTLLKIRPQTYIWGHILIIVCALYGLLIYKPKFEKKDLVISLSFVGIIMVTAMVCNSAFREFLGWNSNYFYLYDYKGTPLKFLYNIMKPSTYGWFCINWLYSLTLIIVFVGVFIGLYYLSRFVHKKLSK